MTRAATCPQHPGIRIDKRQCYKCHPTLSDILPDKESVQAVRAVYDSYGRDAAVLCLELFQEGFVTTATLDQSVSVDTKPAVAEGAQQSSTARGQVRLW